MSPAASAPVETVEARVEAAPPVSTSLNLVDQENPWLGLDSFSEETLGFFHGREEEVGELARRVQRKLLAILFGQSGLGKTSILRAGIVPRLRREGFCPVYVRIDYSPESPPPSEQIKQAIFRATEAHGTWTRPGTAIPGESLWEFLHHRDDVLRDAEGRTLTPLLIFDQFEEIFTLGQDDDFGRKRAAEFIRDLADLVENRPPKSLEVMLDLEESIVERFDFGRADYRILIALREDYLAHLEGLKAEMPSITQNRMRLARMTGDQALSAVTKPGGRLVTQEVAEAIVRFIAGGAELRNAEVEPSLLSLVCRELNNARKLQGRSEISADLLAGSRDTILNEFYERALADQPAGVRKFIEDEMLTESGFRESLAEERVIKAFAAAAAPAGSLPTLVNRRLLRIEERLDVRRVELTHDVLCAVVRASRDMRHEREARDEAERELRAQREREEATRRALVRARKVAAGCAVLAGVAIVSAAFGYVSMQRAREAEANALATRQQAEGARGEAEKLVAYLLEDFHLELEPIGRLDVVADLSRRSLAYYNGLPATLRTPETERNRAIAQARLAAALRYLGKTDEGEKLANESIATLDRLRAAGDNSEATAIGLAVALNTQGRLHADRVKTKEAIESAIRSTAVLEPFTRAPQPSIAVRRAYGSMNIFLGFIQQRAGQDADSAKSLEASRSSFRSIDNLQLNDLQSAALFGEATNWLMDSLENLDRRAEARRLGEEALRVADAILEKRPGHMTALRAQALLASNLASSLGSDGHVREAIAQAEKAVRGWESFVRIDPGNHIAWNNLGAANTNLGFANEAMGRISEGARRFRLASDQARSTKMTVNIARNVAFPYWHSARMQAELGNMAAARKSLADGDHFADMVIEDKSAPQALKDLLAGSKALFESQVALIAGELVPGRERAVEATRLTEKAQPPLQSVELIKAAQLSNTNYLVAQSSLQLGDFASAETHARQAIQLAKVSPIRNPFDAYQSVELDIVYATALAKRARFAEAAAALAPAKRFFAREKVFGDLPLARITHARALHAEALITPANARALLEEARKLIDSVPPELQRARSTEQVRRDIARAG